MPTLNPQHVRAVIELINQSPFFRHLSMPVKDIGPGYSLVELDIGRQHLNPFGGLHGGVYASAIDTAAYWAVYCELAEDLGLITLDLKVDYLAPVRAGKMVIKGRRIKIGKTICLAEAIAMDQNDKWLAHGVSKMMVTPGLQTVTDALAFMGQAQLPPKFLPGV
ncbi:MAG: PaaI family thioesterase [Desulfarculus sp.]|nr:PaaI family thioesterase [Desulfarculus sp.]